MSQVVHDKYSQMVKVGEEYIPAAIIDAQTRDGNDELIVGSTPMQWDDNAGLFLPTDKDNPLEARVRHLEALVGALNATKETNPDAASATLLALLRGLMATGATESTLGNVKTATEALAGTVDSGALKTTLTGRTVPTEIIEDSVNTKILTNQTAFYEPRTTTTAAVVWDHQAIGAYETAIGVWHDLDASLSVRIIPLVNREGASSAFGPIIAEVTLPPNGRLWFLSEVSESAQNNAERMVIPVVELRMPIPQFRLEIQPLTTPSSGGIKYSFVRRF